MSAANPESSMADALAAMRNNRPLRAEEICRDYLLMNPGSIDHLRLLGHALMKQDRLGEAEEQLRQAIKLKPDFPQLHEDLGAVLLQAQRYEESIAALETAIRLEPRLPLAHKKLGEALAAVGRGEEADEQFQEFFDKDPQAGAIAIAANHLKSGRKDEAIGILRDVLKENPDNVTAMRYLGIAYFREEKNFSDAEAWLRRDRKSVV